MERSDLGVMKKLTGVVTALTELAVSFITFITIGTVFVDVSVNFSPSVVTKVVVVLMDWPEIVETTTLLAVFIELPSLNVERVLSPMTDEFVVLPTFEEKEETVDEDVLILARAV